MAGCKISPTGVAVEGQGRDGETESRASRDADQHCLLLLSGFTDRQLSRRRAIVGIYEHRCDALRNRLRRAARRAWRHAVAHAVQYLQSHATLGGVQ